MYPDLSELDADERCVTPGLTVGGKPAALYSAWNPKTVDRHFRWMKEYGLDGVLLQRFVGSIAAKRGSGDVVLKNAVAAAGRHGRVFAIEYDITGGKPDSFASILREDWAYLGDELKITARPGYLHHGGKPVLSIWGMGFLEDRHPPYDPESARQVVDWFRREAPERQRVVYMGGVPSRWRTLDRDARKDAGWAEVYRAMDAIQPWTVGRYRDAAGVDAWKRTAVVPDLAALKERGQIYMPVIFPGFSWYNLKRDAPKNAIPREGGEFLWRQAVNARTAGATCLKIAMFDEVNEGTAVYKLAARRSDAPEQGWWLTLDADGRALPSDWYLRVSRAITRMFHGELPPSEKIPDRP
jgi:hypothetical protein